MPFFPKKHCPMITLAELGGFAEDKDAAKHFKRPIYPFLVVCGLAILCFVATGIATFRLPHGDNLPPMYALVAGISFLIIAASFFGAWCWMFRATPISPRSGKPMEVYQLEDTVKDGKYELVYLCRHSQTYFRLILLQPE